MADLDAQRHDGRTSAQNNAVIQSSIEHQLAWRGYLALAGEIDTTAQA